MPDALFNRSQAIKAAARRVGFDLVGICPAVEPTGITRFREWIQSGYAGRMTYLPDRADAYVHPRSILDGVRSIVMLAVNYKTEPPKKTSAGEGRVSRYAWGEDYHDVLRKMLKELATFVREQSTSTRTRGVVDTAPLMEREFASLAGLGWIGKNTLLLNRQLGSWFFLAALLVDVELAYDEPFESDHCGTCTACLSACPTNAFVEPYVLDARKCISYLTIELRESIPSELRAQLGEWVFGCDVCQEVCPWNNHVPSANIGDFLPRQALNPMPIRETTRWGEFEFQKFTGGSPLSRPRREGLLRNAAIVLGNAPHLDNVPYLESAFQDSSALIRGTAAWALGSHPLPQTREILSRRLRVEQDAAVVNEIRLALQLK